jgi:hypothetical protein
MKVLSGELTWEPITTDRLNVVTFNRGRLLKRSKDNTDVNVKREPRISVGISKTVNCDCYLISFKNGETLLLPYFAKLFARSEKDNQLKWYSIKDLHENYRVKRLCKTWEFNDSYKAGWLSGFTEGEGSLGMSGSLTIQICQRAGETWNKAISYAKDLGITVTEARKVKTGGLGRQDCLYANFRGGKWEMMYILGSLQITRLINNIRWNEIDSILSHNQEDLFILKIEKSEVTKFTYLDTDTKVLIVDGCGILFDETI